MQLGTRWNFGAQAPASLPESMLTEIRNVEQSLIDRGIDSAGWRWTLTWLEGAPIAELDNGTTLRYTPHTGVVSTTFDE